MKRIVEQMLMQYGRQVAVDHSGEKTVVKAFLQPVNASVWSLAVAKVRERSVLINGPLPPFPPPSRIRTV